MKKIVIATDGSPSARGGRHRPGAAGKQGADVTFVHVLPPDDYVVPGRGGPVLAKTAPRRNRRVGDRPQGSC
jgi:nucleotide-binding universal stress UspA family protein